MKHLLVTSAMFFCLGVMGNMAQSSVVSAQPDQLQRLGSPASGTTLDQIRGAGIGSSFSAPGSFLQSPANSPTGSVLENGIKGNAFSGDSGIVNVIQNSGNNVRIDSSVHLNLRFVK